LQASDHRPDLVVQERARLCVYLDNIAAAHHIHPVERFDRALGLAMRRAEGGEIVQPHEPLRRFMHGVSIKRHRHLPGLAHLQRQRRPPVDDAVHIAPADARKARMPVLRHRLGPEDRDGQRSQPGIHPLAEAKGRNSFSHIDMVPSIAQRMHTRNRSDPPREAPPPLR
jgi:hypothetical protein